MNDNFYGDLNAEMQMANIADLIRAGKKIEAIKLYRFITGASLVQAKAAIDNMEQSGLPFTAQGNLSSIALTGLEGLFPDQGNLEPLVNQISILLSQRKKIQAIKLYREATGANLAQAKQVVDQIERRLGLENY